MIYQLFRWTLVPGLCVLGVKQPNTLCEKDAVTHSIMIATAIS